MHGYSHHHFESVHHPLHPDHQNKDDIRELQRLVGKRDRVKREADRENRRRNGKKDPTAKRRWYDCIRGRFDHDQAHAEIDEKGADFKKTHWIGITVIWLTMGILYSFLWSFPLVQYTLNDRSGSPVLSNGTSGQTYTYHIPVQYQYDDIASVCYFKWGVFLTLNLGMILNQLCLFALPLLVHFWKVSSNLRKGKAYDRYKLFIRFVSFYTLLAGLAISCFSIYTGVCFTNKNITLNFSIGIWLMAAFGILEILAYFAYHLGHFTNNFEVLQKRHGKEYLRAKYSHQIVDDQQYSYEPIHRKFISLALVMLLLGFTCTMLGTGEPIFWAGQPNPDILASPSANASDTTQYPWAFRTINAWVDEPPVFAFLSGDAQNTWGKFMPAVLIIGRIVLCCAMALSFAFIYRRGLGSHTYSLKVDKKEKLRQTQILHKDLREIQQAGKRARKSHRAGHMREPKPLDHFEKRKVRDRTENTAKAARKFHNYQIVVLGALTLGATAFSVLEISLLRNNVADAFTSADIDWGAGFDIFCLFFVLLAFFCIVFSKQANHEAFEIPSEESEAISDSSTDARAMTSTGDSDADWHPLTKPDRRLIKVPKVGYTTRGTDSTTTSTRGPLTPKTDPSFPLHGSSRPPSYISNRHEDLCGNPWGGSL